MNTTDARNLINQTLNQLRAARRDENIVMDLLLELDRFETAVNHAVRNGLIDTMEAQAFRVTAESILAGTEPEPAIIIITIVLSRAVAVHVGVSRADRSLADRSLAIEPIEVILDGLNGIARASTEVFLLAVESIGA